MYALRCLAESSENFGPEESRRAAREVFGPRWPDLNYLMPAEPDLAKRLEPEGGDSALRLGVQLQLDDQQLRELVVKMRLDMQASVDDGTVTEALKGAGILAETLLVSGNASEALRALLAEFLTFQQHALFRARNCIPVWKTVDEFDRATAWMQEAMSGAVFASYQSVLDVEPFSKSDLYAILSAERDEIIAEIHLDAAVGINRVLSEIFDSEERYQRRFSQELGRLREDLDGVAGVWRVAYTGFTSIQQDETAAVLLEGETERPLYESSKLAQALVGVEASRPRLMAFFYLLYPARDGRKDETTGRELREKLTGDVVDAVLPEFVQMILPNVIKDRYNGDQHEKGAS
jgi:hypothetical protein